MDERELLIFLHILGGFLIAGGAGAESVLGIVGARTPSTRVIAAISNAQVVVARFLIAPGALILVVFGTWLLAEYGLYDFEEGWISGGYAIWIISTVVGLLYLTPHAMKVRDRARALLADGTEESEELRREADAPIVKLAGMGLNVLLIVAIYIMVVRPGD